MTPGKTIALNPVATLSLWSCAWLDQDCFTTLSHHLPAPTAQPFHNVCQLATAILRCFALLTIFSKSTDTSCGTHPFAQLQHQTS